MMAGVKYYGLCFAYDGGANKSLKIGAGKAYDFEQMVEIYRGAC